MGAIDIPDKFDVHENSTKVNIVNPYRHGSSPPTGDPIQSETTAYMNAIGLPNDSTATIYGKTGAEVWDLFNSCIMIAKNAGVLANIYSWHPMFGTTATTLQYNAINPASHPKVFYGGWSFTAMGNQTNGTNTYAESNFAPTENGMLIDDCAFTIACNSNVAVGGSDNFVSMGCRGGNGGFLILNSKRFTNSFRAIIGETSDTISTTTATSAGINTSSRFGGNIRLWKNDAIVVSDPVSGGGLPNVPVFYGAYNNITNSPILFDVQRFTSECISKGDDTTVSVVHQMLDLWDSGLNRKTW